jgi:hypothetical protein
MGSLSTLSRACLWTAALAFASASLPVGAAAQVRRVEITARESPVGGGRSYGAAGAYENVRGRVYGEVDPRDPRNRIIQDLDLAPRNAAGKVEYVATFSLMKPIDPSRASGVLVYSVVNRGNGAATPNDDGHISLVSGWQGDVAPTATNQTIQVPVARQRGGGSVTGPVLARFVNIPAGTNTAAIRIGSMGSAFYPPAALDSSKATLTAHASETVSGVQSAVETVAPIDWAFADCRTQPFPGTPDPARLCLRNGFDPSRLYQLVYTAKDPLVLGIGLAATRDIVSFFRYAAADTAGTPNPVAGTVKAAIATGTSQAGNFIKTFVHLGFNQDTTGRIVWDGVLPYIAARQTPINFRFAAPGGAGTLYEPGSEPVLWWGPYTDTVRGRKRASLLDRCLATKTCPKVIEAFGSTEFWGLRMSPGLVGTDAVKDIPLPENVRRYYMPGTTHGGGPGGFELASPRSDRCVLPQNPNPMSDTLRAVTVALVAWVTRGTLPPASRYPTIDEGTLVTAAQNATAFPNATGVPFSDILVNSVLDYDFGSSFNYNDMSGIITRQPPAIRRVLPTLVPRVNGDGNETSGVASVLHQAPLGTYLGWNVEASGFFRGQICGFNGGYIPFAATRVERLKAGDPRLSLEERYGTQQGYVCTVRRAAERLVRERFLLRDDADRLIAAAAASKVLPGSGVTPEQRELEASLCR